MNLHTLLSALLTGLAATAAAAQSAPAGADPDYSYRLEAIAGAGYRVTLTSFHGPFHYRDLLLQPRNCSSAAGSPLAAAAQLWVFAQPSATLRATFRVPMSGGGSGCELFTEFDLKANDRPPSTNEVDPEMPGQGQKQHLQQVPEITDLSAADPLLLGQTLTQWGSAVTVTAEQAKAQRNGLCYFGYRYLTLNNGPGHAEGTSNTLRRGSPAGALLAVDDLPALKPIAATTSTGLIGLAPGTTTVVLNIDAAEYVPETNEANNLRRVIVNVQGRCD